MDARDRAPAVVNGLTAYTVSWKRGYTGKRRSWVQYSPNLAEAWKQAERTVLAEYDNGKVMSVQVA